MMTISISSLKANLSAELKKVQKGTKIIVLDHKHPVAELIPTGKEQLFLRKARKKYSYRPLSPLTKKDPLNSLEEDRSDRW